MNPGDQASQLVERLEQNRARFVRFVASKLGSEADAEELLQSALLRAHQSGQRFDDDESLVSWFFAVLKNAVTDHHRRRATAGRAEAQLGLDAPSKLEPELKGAVCACIHGALPSLKPEYAELIAAVDLGERPLPELAAELGITGQNARVRLHRARAALRQELLNTCQSCAAHGCLDCSCHGKKPKLQLEPG